MCTHGARTFLYLSFFPLDVRHQKNGELAQLARASALQAEGQGFESLCLHWFFLIVSEGRRKNNMVK